MGPQQSSTPPAHERAGIRGGARTRSHNRSQSISRKRYKSLSLSGGTGLPYTKCPYTPLECASLNNIQSAGARKSRSKYGGKNKHKHKSRKRYRKGGELQPLTPGTYRNDPNHIWLGGSRPTRSALRKRTRSNSRSSGQNSYPAALYGGKTKTRFRKKKGGDVPDIAWYCDRTSCDDSISNICYNPSANHCNR